MRIERAHLHRIRLRLKAPFRTSFGEERDRECLILSLKAEGLTGWGECAATAEPGYSYETVGTAWHILRDFFLPALFGAEIHSPEVWPERLRGYRGHPMARAAVEMALWDLWGKLEGRSFRELIERMLEMVESFLSAGYRRVKLKIAPGADVQIVRLVRERHSDLALWVDANAAYTLEDRKVFQALDQLSLGLIEQPLAEDDLLGHRDLQSLLQTPVCLDESVHNAREASQALALNACRERLPGHQHQARQSGGLPGGARHRATLSGQASSGVVRRHAGNRHRPRSEPGACLTAGLCPTRGYLGQRSLLCRRHRPTALRA